METDKDSKDPASATAATTTATINNNTSSCTISATKEDKVTVVNDDDDDNNKEEVLPLLSAPPIAERNEDLFIYAGITPSDFPNDILRQSESSTEPLINPPVSIPDPYGWLRDDDKKRNKPEIIQHLQNENAYTNYVTKHIREWNVHTTLYKELLSSVQETDYTTPYSDGNYWYYTRTYQGKSYPIYCRAPKTSNVLPRITWNYNSSSQKEEDDDDSCRSEHQPILPNEEIILDVNLLAKNQSYCDVGNVKISPSGTLIAYTVDYTGDEIYQLYIQNLLTNEMIENGTIVHGIAGSICFGKTDSTIYYEKLHTITHRPYQVYQHTILNNNNNKKNNTENNNTENKKDDNTDNTNDILLFEDLDEMHWIGIHKSIDNEYLFIESSSKETNEIYYIRLQQEQDVVTTTTTLQCISKRRPKVLYDIAHRSGYWWISSNVGNQPNMALYVSPAIPNCENHWQLVKLLIQDDNKKPPLVVVPCFDGGYQRSIDYVQCFTNHIVVSGREDGLPRIWILGNINHHHHNDDDTSSSVNSPVTERMECLTFTEDAFDVGLGTNKEYGTNTINVSYSSLTTPPQTIQIDLNDTKQRYVLKEKTIPGYNKELYGCNRMTVLSRDGTTQIPISMVYRNDIMEQYESTKQPVPVHLYGYGSYGACVECDYNARRLPLLNRGIVYIIAHIRGGGEMGRQWYEEPNGAKYLCKKNTFYDFVDIAKWLIYDKQLTTSDLLSCEGRSAGGMLIGSSINLNPELFRVALLGVPFVDVVATMIDARIPLTAVEWEEWGNPNEIKYHQYMMEYSPMQNVCNKVYPACLITCGLHDPRVQYWEAAKFAAELRYKQAEGSGPVCLKIDMSAGHFSASDRYKHLKEKAFEYAFLLDQLGLLQKEVK